MRSGKVAVWAASLCLPRVPRFVASGRTRPLRVTSTKSSPKKWRPTFFPLSGDKKVGRYKSGKIKDLWRADPAPSTAKWRIWARKKSPFFRHGSVGVCGG